jgi:hypothetical protein
MEMRAGSLEKKEKELFIPNQPRANVLSSSKRKLNKEENITHSHSSRGETDRLSLPAPAQ